MDRPVCPHCGAEMVKEAIQLSDLSGWTVGWSCECTEDEEHIEVFVHADRDWTAAILYDDEEVENG